MNQVPKASDVLADELRAMILGGGMEEGEILPSEAKLMEEYSFSRGTVRETLRLLEADGLIVIKRGAKGGIRVRHPDIRQVNRSLALILTANQAPLRDLFAFRRLIEPAAAAKAARSATEDQRKELVRIAPHHYGVSHGFRESAEFHGAVGRASNNELFAMMLSALHDVLEWQATDEVLGHDDIQATQKAHISIAEAIADGDAEVASRRMSRHLEEFEKVLGKQGRLDDPTIPRSRWRRRIFQEGA